MTKSRILLIILVGLLALLSFAAGIPKVMQMTQELEFLATLGMGGTGVALLGAVQILGGMFLITSQLRLVGVLFSGLAFLISSLALMVGGNSLFGVVSLLPVVLLGVVHFLQRMENSNRVK